MATGTRTTEKLLKEAFDECSVKYGLRNWQRECAG
jgi:hypothetical protein